MSTISIILSILSGIICVALGLFTLSRNPKHPANIGFALGMAGFAVMEAGDLITFISLGVPPIGMKLSIIGQAVLPPAWAIFAVTFARANHNYFLSRWKTLMGGMAAVSIVFAGISFSSFATLVATALENNSAPVYVIGQVGRYFNVYLILAFVFIMAQLESTLRSSRGMSRWQIKYIIFGIGSMIAYMIYLSSHALLFSVMRPETMPLTPIVLIITTSMMAVFIIRHKLMDVNIFISRYVIYNSLTVLAVGAYFMAIGLVIYGVKLLKIPFNSLIIPLFVFVSALAMVIVFFTSSIRRKIQLFINRNFYSHKYEFRDKWLETTEKISSKGSEKEISDILVELLSGTMGADDVRLWLFDPVMNGFFLTVKSTATSNEMIGQDHPVIKVIYIVKGPFLFADMKDDVTADEMEKIKKLAGPEGVICAPLLADQDLLGFLIQSSDISGEPYRDDDFELLKAITTQAAVQLKNIRLAQNLTSIKEIETFNKLSTFVMHDLKNLTNSLSLISQNARFNMENPEFQKDALRTVDNTVKKMKILIEKLSNVPKGIELKVEMVSLEQVLESAVAKIPQTTSDGVEIVRNIEDLPHVLVDREAMEMVFINILLNACEAMGKGVITLTSLTWDGRAEIKISDSGPGISIEFLKDGLFRPFRTTKKNGLGIGLFQCKAMVEAHGGSIEVESEQGRGTTFTIKLPLPENVQKGNA